LITKGKDLDEDFLIKNGILAPEQSVH
jgi:hypothetical protein